jgi:hypothetical protein
MKFCSPNINYYQNFTKINTRTAMLFHPGEEWKEVRIVARSMTPPQINTHTSYLNEYHVFQEKRNIILMIL